MWTKDYMGPHYEGRMVAERTPVSLAWRPSVGLKEPTTKRAHR